MERRQTFLVTGRRMWSELGLAALTVRGLCTEAGLADRYFYTEFGNLDGLIVAIAKDVGAQLLTSMVTSGAVGTTTEERLLLGLTGFLQPIVDDPSIMAVMNNGVATGDLADVRQEGQRAVATAIMLAINPTAAAEDGGTDFQAAYFCVGGVTLLIEQWLTSLDRTTPAQLAEQAMELCSKVLDI